MELQNLEVGSTFKFNQCLDKLDFGQTGCLMIICFPLQFIESEGLKTI